MAPRCRRCFESGSGRAARAGTLGRAAGAARGGRHGRLAAGHARPGGARSARRAARRVAHRERAAAAARNDGRLGISRALGAPPRRVLLRPTPAGAVCVGAPLEPDRADEGLRRARELRSRGTRPPRLVGAGPHAAVRPVRARVDGARARPRARSRGTAEVRRARAARVVPAALRFLGGCGCSGVAVDVPPRFRVDQSRAGTRGARAGQLARGPQDRAPRGDARVRVDAAGLPTDGLPRGPSGDSPGVPGRCSRRRCECLATLLARDVPAAPARDAVRAGDRNHRRVPGVGARHGADGRWAARRHRCDRISHLPDRLGAAAIR